MVILFLLGEELSFQTVIPILDFQQSDLHIHAAATVLRDHERQE